MFTYYDNFLYFYMCYVQSYMPIWSWISVCFTWRATTIDDNLDWHMKLPWDVAIVCSVLLRWFWFVVFQWERRRHHATTVKRYRIVKNKKQKKKNGTIVSVVAAQVKSYKEREWNRVSSDSFGDDFWPENWSLTSPSVFKLYNTRAEGAHGQCAAQRLVVAHHYVCIDRLPHPPRYHGVSIVREEETI